MECAFLPLSGSVAEVSRHAAGDCPKWLKAQLLDEMVQTCDYTQQHGLKLYGTPIWTISSSSSVPTTLDNP